MRGPECEGLVKSTGGEKIARLLRHRIIVPASAALALRIIRTSVNFEQAGSGAVPRGIIDRVGREKSSNRHRHRWII